jgi:hypothetical protein
MTLPVRRQPAYKPSSAISPWPPARRGHFHEKKQKSEKNEEESGQSPDRKPPALGTRP